MPTDKMIKSALDRLHCDLRARPTPKQTVLHGASKYGYYTTMQATNADPLKQVLKSTKYSRKKVTLVRIPKGKSD